MNIKDLVAKANIVSFLHYRKGELMYQVMQPTQIGDELEFAPIFTFPVPISDCADGTFKATDRAITFMRYIRKQLEAIEAENAACNEMLNSQHQFTD